MKIEHKSLSQLGLEIGNSNPESLSGKVVRREIREELARRIEYKRSVAEGLFDYHANAFKRDSSPKAWNELVAIMYVLQALSKGGTLERDAVD